MTTTSGSPTQNGSSGTTVGDLQGTPDDAFVEGDLGYVHDLWPNASFRLKRGASASPDGTTILSTFSQNGYWELLAQSSSSSVPLVDRVEDLGNTQSGTTSGSFVYVKSVRSYFQKVVEPDGGNADGITIVRDASTAATWYRLEPRHLSWELQANWYIDASAGDDQNPGTALNPLATFAEFARRVRMVRVATTVYVTTATTEVLRGEFMGASAAASLSVRGVPTVLASGATTTFTAMVPTTNTLGTVACAEIPNLATYVGAMLQVTHLGRKLTTHIIKNSAGTAVIGGVFAGENLYSYNPIPNNNPLEVITVVPVGSFQVLTSLMPAYVYYLRQTSTADTDAFVFEGTGIYGSWVNSCEFEGDVEASSTRAFSGCLFMGTGTDTYRLTFRAPLGGYTLGNGGTYIERTCHVPFGRAVFQGTIVYKAGIIFGEPDSGRIARITSSAAGYSVGVFESSTHGFVIHANAVAGYRYLFGKDNAGYGAVIQNGARIITVGAYTPSVTGALGDFLYRSGGDQIPPLVAGANVSAVQPFATWANFTAAPFSGSIFSYEDGTIIAAR